MLEKVKLALRIKTNALDDEINDTIEAALADLGIAGVIPMSDTDPLIVRAVITYCKLHIGNTPDYDRMKASYDEQKAQLQTATGYTDWGDTESCEMTLHL
ncbi:MAG: head-tail connector protein [Candidatus Merdivicinus sp.]|jgi:hypothetical protein